MLSVLTLVLLSSNLIAQNIKVTGKVIDKADLPGIGVSVLVQGTNTGVATDLEGLYEITAPANGTLVFSAIGMKTVTVPINGRSIINVTMEVDALLLDELVITALGMKKERKALGYAVSDIKSEELMRNKTANPISSLSGKIAGVNITQSSGAAGSGAQIILRGGTSGSEGKDNQPLFVVDGIIYDNSSTLVGNSA
ncbi:MAG: carboxypeptidase-like regulatory domain-containing protein, partial [Bacteroidales bacterium]